MPEATTSKTTIFSPLTFKALDPATGRVSDCALPLVEPPGRCSFRLRVLPGATGLHLAFSLRETVVRRFEVPGTAGETVTLEVDWAGGDNLSLTSQERPVLTLPPDGQYRPPEPLLPQEPGAPLDLAILVDGTTRSYRQEPEPVPVERGDPRQTARAVSVAEALLGPQGREPWGAFVDQLLAVAAELAGLHSDCRTAVLAFGDAQPPLATAADLKPEYHLYPKAKATRNFRSFEAGALRAQLLAIPPTSGADFVDALADGLAACGDLHWRAEARKLVILVGDSPGSSVLHPAPQGSNARARSRDVDLEATELHGQRIELATVYFHPPAESGLFALELQQSLLRFAREQYHRLASLPEWAFEAGSFEGRAAAQTLKPPTSPLGRTATLGERVEIPS